MKGRDWYDLVWYAGHHPQVNLGHLETRMRRSGDYSDDEPLTRPRLLDLLRHRIQHVNVAELRKEVAPFLREPRSLEVWSQQFFLQVIERIEVGKFRMEPRSRCPTGGRPMLSSDLLVVSRTGSVKLSEPTCGWPRFVFVRKEFVWCVTRRKSGAA